MYAFGPINFQRRANRERKAVNNGLHTAGPLGRTSINLCKSATLKSDNSRQTSNFKRNSPFPTRRLTGAFHFNRGVCVAVYGISSCVSFSSFFFLISRSTGQTLKIEIIFSGCRVGEKKKKKKRRKRYESKNIEKPRALFHKRLNFLQESARERERERERLAPISLVAKRSRVAFSLIFGR